jgi:hypothetical protein
MSDYFKDDYTYTLLEDWNSDLFSSASTYQGYTSCNVSEPSHINTWFPRGTRHISSDNPHYFNTQESSYWTNAQVAKYGYIPFQNLDSVTIGIGRKSLKSNSLILNLKNRRRLEIELNQPIESHRKCETEFSLMYYDESEKASDRHRYGEFITFDGTYEDGDEDCNKTYGDLIEWGVTKTPDYCNCEQLGMDTLGVFGSIPNKNLKGSATRNSTWEAGLSILIASFVAKYLIKNGFTNKKLSDSQKEDIKLYLSHIHGSESRSILSLPRDNWIARRAGGVGSGVRPTDFNWALERINLDKSHSNFGLNLINEKDITVIKAMNQMVAHTTRTSADALAKVADNYNQTGQSLREFLEISGKISRKGLVSA